MVANRKISPFYVDGENRYLPEFYIFVEIFLLLCDDIYYCVQ